VICLLSKHWLHSHERETEFRYAETLNKTILCVRLDPVPDTNITSEWQRCDLFPGHGPTTDVEIGDGGDPVVLDTVGCNGCWRRCGPWGSGPSTSRGRRRAIPTVPRIGGGHRWMRPMRRCS
jgi:hypothetical protein